jgi:hypothetical protein
MTEPCCYYFGCLRRGDGHRLYEPGDVPCRHDGSGVLRYGPAGVHVDGTLAPRVKYGDGGAKIVWGAYGGIPVYTPECPEGEFLLHHLDNGFTAMAWWDRQQGDRRPNSNSVLLYAGKHSADEMVAALREHFPQVLKNLRRSGVTLRQVGGKP